MADILNGQAILNLDDIKLPDGDSEKPADINLNPSEGDTGVVHDTPNPNDQLPGDTGTPTPGDTGVNTADAGTSHADGDTGSPNPDTGVLPPPAADTGVEKLTPFHEHPDWKKMQDRLERLEQEKQELQEKLTPPAPVKDPKQVAREKLEADIANGWTPKDRIAEMERYQDYYEKAREEQMVEQRKAADRSQQAVAQSIDKTLDILEIKDEKDRETVLGKVMEWRKQGMDVNQQSVHTAIQAAAQVLKAEGKIGTPAIPPTPNPVPTPPPTPAVPAVPTKEQQQRKEQDNANLKLRRPGASGNQSTPGSKPDSKYLRSRDLDTIVQEQAAKLG